MTFKFARKSFLCALGLIAMGAMSAPASAQSTEFRRGYDQGYRDGTDAQARQAQPGTAVGRIIIDEARYGLRDSTCDVKDKVQQAVGWRRNVSITANNDLCGDPAPSRPKRLVITYRCGQGDALRAQAKEGASAILNCR